MKKIFLFLIAGMMLCACSKDVMDRTIFVPDQEDAQLPAYTEWGYNSFGAEYERSYFLASNRIIPCKVVYTGGQLQFALCGMFYERFGYGQDMTLSFIFPFAQISEYKDLVQLDGVKIDLADSACTVKLLQNNVETTLGTVQGELYFKRAQLLSIDEVVNRVILSGTFEVRFLQNGLPWAFSNGRFDMGITGNVFYSN